MTEKQRRFCREYLTDRDGTLAALRAGYTPNRAAESGRRLLREEAIRAYIEELKEQQKRRAVMDQDEILAGLSAIARGEKEGAKISEISKALELMGRYYGTFSEKKESESTAKGVSRRVRDMTLSERKDRLDALLSSFREDGA